KPLSFLSMSLSVSEAAAPPPLASAIPLPFISSLGDLIYRFRRQRKMKIRIPPAALPAMIPISFAKQNISYGYLFTNLGGQPFGQVPVLLDGHLKLTDIYFPQNPEPYHYTSRFCKEISENPIHSAPVATKGISVNEPVIWMVLGEVMPDRSVVGWILRDVKGEMKCLRGAPSVSSGFDVARSNTHFKLSDSNVLIYFNNLKKFFEITTPLFRFGDYRHHMALANTNTRLPSKLVEGTIFLEIKRLVSNIFPAAALMEKGQMVMTRATKVCKPLEPVEPIRWSSYSCRIQL
ncbi:hypothetical protein HID58_019346, partial [Brassica napus]